MDILKEFPLIEPLDDELYTKMPYKDLPLRRAKIMLFTGAIMNYDGFKIDSKEKEDKLKKIVMNIEMGCYNYSVKKINGKNINPTWTTPQMINVYNSVCYRIAESIDCKSNLNSSFLVKWILRNPSEAGNLSYMSAEDLCPYNNIEIRKKIKSRLQQEVQIKYTSMYKCYKCGQSKCIMRRIQTRSQDEGSSTICVCICGHSWTYR